MEQNVDKQQRPAEQRLHEEAIVPVRPGLGGSAGAPAARSRAPAGPLLIWGALAVLLLATAAVFIALPKWVALPAGEPDGGQQTSAEQIPAEPAEPALSEEEIAALTDRADALLAQLLTQQQQLEQLSAPNWGGDDWQRYQGLGRAGDDAYLADALQDAIEAYGEALEVGEGLLARSSDIIDRALSAGQQALEAGDAALALEQFDLVLSIDTAHDAAEAGRARAERLPEVLELSRQADALQREGRLAEAADVFRAALAIDRAWAPARRGLEDVERRIAVAEFDAVMSAGMQALADGRYGDAEREFQAALQMRPESAEARDGLMQAGQGLKLDQIALAEARALAFERREMWREAIAQYQDALATDDTLTFASTGLARARTRADLDAKLSNLIENPNLLFRDDVLESARQLLDEAEVVAAGGEAAVAGAAADAVGGAMADAAADAGDANPRLREQIRRLNELLALASTPVPVRIESDGQTEVTLYRVGPLGAFASKQLELRPGNYTAVGARDGFRDVRRTFTVLPGRELGPIRVMCVEPI